MECCEICRICETCERVYPRMSELPPCAQKARLKPADVSECPKCHCLNIKCRGAISNCEDCGHVWKSTPASVPVSANDIDAVLQDSGNTALRCAAEITKLLSYVEPGQHKRDYEHARCELVRIIGDLREMAGTKRG
jgi:hypothetical protein